MDKRIVLRARDEERGIILSYPLLPKEMDKLAFDQTASKLHPSVKDFVRNVRSSKAGIFVLVNAMGSSEFWGQNSNGDIFNEDQLCHAPPGWADFSPEKMREVGRKWEYGFPTFMSAHPFQHHRNKDASQTYGRIDLAIWNPRMHRVELVLYLDRELAHQNGALSVIERIENGEYPDWSMGTRVPFDICTVCGHRSKTRRDYCDHTRLWMGRILENGLRVGVINFRPRFFDISCVFIGADKTAKTMAKIAHTENRICLGDFCTVPRSSAEVGEYFPPLRSQPEVLFDITKTAGGAVKRQTTFDGHTIKIEFDPGDTRTGENKATGKKWERTMYASYGYIPKTRGDDGEAVDVYLAKDPKPGSDVYVVHQKKKDGSPDEDKVMLGFSSKEDAKSIYQRHVPDWCFGSIATQTPAAFDSFIEDFAKTASMKESCTHEVCECGCEDQFTKLAHAIFPIPREKTSSHRKVSEILKSVPAGPFSRETLPKLESAEPEIPKTLMSLMSTLGIGPALSTSGMMGIVLKPHEFQRLLLTGIGSADKADDLERSNTVFGPTDEVDESLEVKPEQVHEGLKNKLLPLVQHRSAAAPVLSIRIMRISISPAPPKNTEKKSDSPLLQKIAAAYNGYRRSLLKKATAVQQYLVSDPLLRAELFGRSLVTAFAGGVEKTASTSVFSPDSLAYLMGAHYENRDFHTASNAVLGSLAQTGAIAEAAA